jgi:hypothetical protein
LKFLNPITHEAVRYKQEAFLKYLQDAQKEHISKNQRPLTCAWLQIDSCRYPMATVPCDLPTAPRRSSTEALIAGSFSGKDPKNIHDPIGFALRRRSMEIKMIQTPPEKRKAKPSDESTLGFGKIFTDHFFTMPWHSDRG